MKTKVIVWVFIAVVAAVLLSLVLRPSGGGIVNVDAAGAQKAIDGGAQVIDVRTVSEFQLGHIPGALNVPVDTLEEAAQSWDRDATYVVYCATGQRSATAVEIMKSLGFTSIRHLSAGIQSWTDKLETGAQSSDQKVQTSGKPVFIDFYSDS